MINSHFRMRSVLPPVTVRYAVRGPGRTERSEKVRNQAVLGPSRLVIVRPAVKEKVEVMPLDEHGKPGRYVDEVNPKAALLGCSRRREIGYLRDRANGDLLDHPARRRGGRRASL